MIWHIFKKDLRLLWPMALAVAGLHWTGAIVAALMFNGFVGLRTPAALLVIGGLAATGFLIMAAVHQDAIPGVRQDWLVRPIRRRDLMLAKLLFALLLVQLPILIADVGTSLASGFSIPSTLSTALQRSLVQMLVVNLPFLAFGSVTRNLMGVVSGGVVLGLGVGVVVGLTPSSSPLVPLSRTGLSWIEVAVVFVILTCGAAGVLGLQYSRRHSFAGRGLIVCVAALCVLSQFMPWQPAFVLQQSLAAAPGSSRDISLDFDSAAGRFHSPVGTLTPEDLLVSIKSQNDRTFHVYLPFRVTGLPEDSTVIVDHSEVQLIEKDGRRERLVLDRWNTRHAPMGLVYPQIEIPAATYKRIKDQPVRLEVDHWLTFVQLASSFVLPSLDGKQHIPGIGPCNTRINDSETAVSLTCLEPETVPDCFAFFLEHEPTGQRNPDRFNCGSSYAPLIVNPLIPVSFWTSGANLPFRDSSGLATFPVDGSRLPESRVVIQLYRPRDHFTRKLVIAEVRLGEWEAETP